MSTKIAIVGCGGIGSRVGVELARLSLGLTTDVTNFNLNFILVDCDIVEEKNLNRQNFYRESLNLNKTDELKRMMQNINPALEIEIINKKLETESDLVSLTDASLIIAATDNNRSKQMLELLEKPTIHVFCDEGIIEIRTKLSESDLNIWGHTDGYSSTQNLYCNTIASAIVVEKIREIIYTGDSIHIISQFDYPLEVDKNNIFTLMERDETGQFVMATNFVKLR